MARRKITRRQIIEAAISAVVLVLGVWTICSGQVERPKPQAVILSRGWQFCPPCKAAEDHLEQIGCDVTVVKMTKQQSDKLGVRSFPTVLIGGEVVVGHDPKRFRRALR